MTMRERFTEKLVERGMFQNQAEAVMALAVPKIDALVPDYRLAWDRPAEEYPAPLYAVLWITVTETALAWIDANQPKAWYRPMFAPEAVKK